MSTAHLVTLYDPTAEPRAAGLALAPRPATLQGRRAGILDNGKANAGLLMSAILERLRASHGVGEVITRQKPVAGPPAPEVLADLARCDVVLVGSAD
jgi:hypothetical protein